MVIDNPFTINIYNAFWYPALYGFLTMIVMQFIDKSKRKKILTFTSDNSLLCKVSNILSFVCRYGLMVIALFSPLQMDTINFFIGSAIALLGICLSVYAMWVFSTADLNKPITTGIYKISRNPMQVMLYVMWLGVYITTRNFAMFFLLSVYFISAFPLLKTQEKYCIEKYGSKYFEYMKETPRILFFI